MIMKRIVVPTERALTYFLETSDEGKIGKDEEGEIGRVKDRKKHNEQ